jgi:hypothetical protein
MLRVLCTCVARIDSAAARCTRQLVSPNSPDKKSNLEGILCVLHHLYVTTEPTQNLGCDSLNTAQQKKVPPYPSAPSPITKTADLAILSGSDLTAHVRLGVGLWRGSNANYGHRRAPARGASAPRPHAKIRHKHIDADSFSLLRSRIRLLNY